MFRLHIRVKPDGFCSQGARKGWRLLVTLNQRTLKYSTRETEHWEVLLGELRFSLLFPNV